MHMLCRPEKAGDVVAEKPKVLDLAYQVLTHYHVMVKTLTPKKANHKVVEGVMRNLLVSLAYSTPFNIKDFFIMTLE